MSPICNLKEFINIVISDFYDNWEMWWYYCISSKRPHMRKCFWYAINMGWCDMNNIHPTRESTSEQPNLYNYYFK